MKRLIVEGYLNPKDLRVVAAAIRDLPHGQIDDAKRMAKEE